jgi:hypothetical protein
MNLLSVWKLLYYQGDYVPEKIEIAKAGDTLDTVGKKLPGGAYTCLLYTSPSPRDRQKSRMPSSA